jgi:hypothetical protein
MQRILVIAALVLGCGLVFNLDLTTPLGIEIWVQNWMCGPDAVTILSEAWLYA